MKILLDSHVLVWALLTPRSLSRNACRVLEDPKNELYVSSASVWELFIKFHKGKFAEAANLFQGFDDNLKRLGACELAITHRHAKKAALLRHPHPDPFDRMIAAQSILEEWPVVTNDAFLAELGADVIW